MLIHVGGTTKSITLLNTITIFLLEKAYSKQVNL